MTTEIIRAIGEWFATGDNTYLADVDRSVFDTLTPLGDLVRGRKIESMTVSPTGRGYALYAVDNNGTVVHQRELTRDKYQILIERFALYCDMPSIPQGVTTRIYPLSKGAFRVVFTNNGMHTTLSTRLTQFVLLSWESAALKAMMPPFLHETLPPGVGNNPALSILVVGGPSSGKTTFLNSLLTHATNIAPRVPLFYVHGKDADMSLQIPFVWAGFDDFRGSAVAAVRTNATACLIPEIVLNSEAQDLGTLASGMTQIFTTFHATSFEHAMARLRSHFNIATPLTWLGITIVVVISIYIENGKVVRRVSELWVNGQDDEGDVSKGGVYKKLFEYNEKQKIWVVWQDALKDYARVTKVGQFNPSMITVRNDEAPYALA